MTTKIDLTYVLYDSILFDISLPHLTVKDCQKAIEAILFEITSALTRHEKVEIRGFGRWNARHKKERVGLNPKTGERHPVPERHVVQWTAGSKLKKLVNGD